MPRKQTAHAQLDQLDQRIAAARLAEREAEVALAAADAHIELARDQVRSAHDLGQDPAEPTEGLEQAKHDAEQAALAREGIAQRVRRASEDRARFIEENGEQLLAELGPACDEVTQDMRTHAEQLLADHARWGALSSQVAGYLMAMRLSPADNSPGEHHLTPLIRDVKRALTHEISSPAPHWFARDAARDEHARKTQLKEVA